MSNFNDLVKYLTQSVDDSAFWTSVMAGLLVMFVDFVLLVIGVSLAVSWWQKRQWERTRKSLAYILLNSTGSVMQNFRACLFEKDEMILLNAAIELHLQRLELSLSNINEQMTVHLPAALPPLTEKLSTITRDISVLRESVLAMRLYLGRLKWKIELYDGKGEQNKRIDPEQFIYDEDGAVHLRPGTARSDENFFFLFTTQMTYSTLELNKKVVKFFSLYSNGGRRYSTEQKMAKITLAYLEEERHKAIVEASKMKAEGLNLLLYAPIDEELNER